MQCVYGRSMDFLGQIRTCNKQSCLCSPSIPECRLYGDIPLGSSNPRCSPYRTIPCSHLQQRCDISIAHPGDAKAVWKPYGNNRHGEIARPAQASLRFCQWKPIQVTAVAQETSGCTKFGNRLKQIWASENLQTYASKVSRGMAQATWRCVCPRAQDFFLILRPIFSTRSQLTTWQRKGRLDASTMNWKSEDPRDWKLRLRQKWKLKAMSSSSWIRPFWENKKMSNKTNELMKSWVGQQNQLTCAGVTMKETEKLKIDKRQNSDLSKLKDIGVHLF